VTDNKEVDATEDSEEGNRREGKQRIEEEFVERRKIHSKSTKTRISNNEAFEQQQGYHTNRE